jgi:hypothetical protein
MLFVRAYPRESQEMVFDARDRAFALFKSACGRGIYDDMKAAVETVFGMDRPRQSPPPSDVQPLPHRTGGLQCSSAGALRNGAPFKNWGAAGRHGARAAQARQRRRR